MRPIIISAGLFSPLLLITSAVSQLQDPPSKQDTPINQLIVFEVWEGDAYEIHVADADGKSSKRLSSKQGVNSAPRWSPGKDLIAFLSRRESNRDIFLMGADGSNVKRLTRTEGVDGTFAWSPDGSRIAFATEATGDGDVYVVKIADGSTSRITSTSRLEYQPCWSPDGQQIAFVSTDGKQKYDLCVVQADGTKRRTIIKGDRLMFPQWSPKGDVILMRRFDKNGSKPTIYSCTLDGMNFKAVTTSLGDQFDFAISPDGSEVALYAQTQNGFGVFVMGVDGSNLRRVCAYPGRNSGNLAWSRDSKWLVFTSYHENGERAQPELYRVDRNGENLTRLTQSPAIELHPDW